MSDFQPGDVVVCVDGAQCPCHTETTRVRTGAVYRVTDTAFLRAYSGKLVFCVRTDRHNPNRAGEVGWHHHDRFRKIRPADESFTRQMHSLRPIKTKEHA